MKKMLYFMFAASVLLASCATEPEACFTISKEDNVNVGEEVQFSAACSEDASSYNWNFGDGQNASGITVSHTYSTAGTYNVELNVANASQSNEASAVVKVVQ